LFVPASVPFPYVAFDRGLYNDGMLKSDRFSLRRRWIVCSIVIATLTVFVLFDVLRVRATYNLRHLGYGFNVAVWDWQREQNMGFNWIKVFTAPSSPLPLHVLLRIDVQAGLSTGQLLADLDANLINKDYIEAWEIGNEVNLDASYGWNAPPDPVAYKNLLCAAYSHIKAADPAAIVVSAGLAPTGRVNGNYNGHLGHDGQKQDEREFLRELLANGGGACLDVVGYHPYGFSADYDTPPDTGSLADPPTDCENGFCFRGVEKIYEIMQNNGLGDKKVWATEFGWLVRPPDNCLSDPSFGGRTWQLVSADKQAYNLAGAFQYADEHWPWMGAMFVFNLNFNTDPSITNPCEQMRYYSIQPPAEAALTNMPKYPADVPARMKVLDSSIGLMIQADWQPITPTIGVNLSNWGWQSFAYTVTIDAGANVVPTVISSTGRLSPTVQIQVPMLILSVNRVAGIYTGTVTFTASPGTLGALKSIPIELRVVDQVYQVFLPLTLQNSP
jgi:hypothetical protein